MPHYDVTQVDLARWNCAKRIGQRLFTKTKVSVLAVIKGIVVKLGKLGKLPNGQPCSKCSTFLDYPIY